MNGILKGMAAALLAAGMLGSASPASQAAEALPSEGNFSATYFMSDIGIKSLPKVGGTEGFSGDLYLIYQNDAGSGFLHNATGYCLYVGSRDAHGAVKANARCLYSDQDGDTFHSIIESRRDTKDGPQTSSGTYADGTGKYAGIVGSFANKISWLRSPFGEEPGPQDADYAIGHTTGNYRIVKH